MDKKKSFGEKFVDISMTAQRVKCKFSHIIFNILSVIFILISIFLFVFMGWQIGVFGLVFSLIFFSLAKFSKWNDGHTANIQEEFNNNLEDRDTDPQ